ncbi:MAG: AAA family ATPase, partial [Rhodomicrobium sp.]|nr:AAA family ATPase [Rhodomicrobium sp.]
MKLHIERAHAEALAGAFMELAGFKDQLRFSDRVEIEAANLPKPAIEMLHKLYLKAGPALQLRAAQLATLIAALHGDGRRFRKSDLEEVLPAIVRHLLAHGTRGWLFTAQYTSRPLPFVITRLDYTPATNDEAGRVFIELKANAKAALLTTVIRLGESDVEGKTIGEILAAKGFLA